jgi:hypothetical protein
MTMNMTIGAHEHHHEGAQQIGHGGQQAVHLAFLIGGRALEHLFQLAAALAAADQVNHHGGEEFAGGQRLADGRAFTNPQRRFLDRLFMGRLLTTSAEIRSASSTGYGARGQNAEGAGKARRVQAADEFPARGTAA